MSNIKEIFDAERKNRIQQLENEIAILRATDLQIPELSDVITARPNYSYPKEIWIEFPASFVIRDRVCATLEAEGWVKYRHGDFESWFYDEVCHPDHPYKLILAFYLYREGATCICRQIGTKEVPILEWLCPEGAAETV
jgi:hypothetical protein